MNHFRIMAVAFLAAAFANAQCPVITVPNSLTLTNCATGNTIAASSNYATNITSKWIGPGNVPIHSVGTSTSVANINLIGTYTVQFRDNISNCMTQSVVTVTTSLSKPLFQLASPAPSFAMQCPNSTVVANIVNAQTYPTMGGPVTYTFAPLSAPIPTAGLLGMIATYSVNTCGTYVAMTRDNSSGCSSSYEFAVACSTVPVANVSITPSSSTVCAGAAATLQATGALSYLWSNLVSGATVAILPMVSPSSPTTPVTTTLMGTDAYGCVTAATATVYTDLSCAKVWPGDANYDGVVDNLDVFEIGLAFSSTGQARNPGGNSFTGQFAASWTGSVSTGWNKAHADCNGDGTVNNGDTLAIYNNFSMSHAFKVSGVEAGNDITIVPSQALVLPGTWNTADVMAGSTGNSLSQVFGLAFDVAFSSAQFDPGDVYMSYVPSFINAGAGNVQFHKTDNSAGRVHAATVRTDGANVSGSGKIATLYFRPKSGLADNTVITFSVVSPSRINAAGTVGSLTGGTASVTTDQTAGLKDYSPTTSHGSFYPNPSKGSIYLLSESKQPLNFEITDVTGRVVSSGAVHGVTEVQLGDAGVYLLKLSDGVRPTVRKIVVE